MTLKERIYRLKDGKILFRDSFPEFQDEYVGNVYSELVKEGVLVRLSQGVYCKPIQTRLGPLYPSVDELITAIAKHDHATIMPTGNTAMHQLGLTTQVPVNYEFLTNGAARRLVVGNNIITLKHGVAANFAFRGKMLPVLHQALRAIGKDNVSNEMEDRIASLIYQNPEPNSYRHDLGLLTQWEREIVEPIYKKCNEQMD